MDFGATLERAESYNERGANPGDFVLSQIEKRVRAVDKDHNGTITYKQFDAFLKHYELQAALLESEFKLVYKCLADDNADHRGRRGEAHIAALMLTVGNVLADHPNYSARRAVFRALKRLLKVAKSTYGK